MVVIRFFASLRESLGTGEVSLPSDSLTNVADVLKVLSDRGDQWRDALAAKNLLVAVNHHHADQNTPLSPGDEIAIFPPVTGG